MLGLSQDVIFKKTGDEIQAKVLEILPDIVKYKKISNMEGPTYSILIEDVFMIKYQNGTKDVFNQNKPSTNLVNVPVNSNKNETKKKIEHSTFIDSRDNQEYKTVKIGENWWMAENLNFTSGESWCYDYNPEYCLLYGRLYTFEAANAVCPDGWHLPSDVEWKKLEIELGMKDGIDDEGWRGTSPGQGFKLKKGGGSGFNAELSGFKNIGSYGNPFGKLSSSGFFWTSSEDLKNTRKAFIREIGNRASIKRSSEQKELGLSVRCIKD
jgi:uncharacterized protein (TIGR02145 family)